MRTVAAGITISAATRSAPTALRVAVTVSATTASRAKSNHAEFDFRPVAESSSKPLASQWAEKSLVAMIASTAAEPASIRSIDPIASSEPKSRVSTFAPEPKTSLARITPAARQATSASAVTLSAAARLERASRAETAVNTPAMPNAPRAAGKPSPSASTSPGKEAVPIAWE